MKIPDLIPRDYQVQMMEAALENNIVACLGTGTGKTYIGVLVIKELSHQVRPPFEQDGKRTFFLVPTVPLVHQQANVLKQLTDLEVCGFWGDMKVDTWSKEMWHEQFVKYHVLVMTAEIFRVILEHGFMSLSKVNLIVFDECHRAVKHHPYREIMRNFDLCQQHPKVLGLTASILNGKCKPGKLEKKIKDLEESLRSKAIVPDESSQINQHGTKPKEYLCSFRPYTGFQETDGEIGAVRILLKMALAHLPNEEKVSTDRLSLNGGSDDEFDYEDDMEVVSPSRDARKYINDVLYILESLGPWCTRVSMEVFLDEINSAFDRGQLEGKSREALEIVKSVFQRSIKIINILMSSLVQLKDRVIGQFMPPKLQKLLEILLSKHPLLLTGDQPMCGLIFVQKRFVAYILNRWLNTVSQLPEYNYIKSNFMVGHGSQMYATEIKEICMASKQQGKILQAFRDGTYNLLVASSVIEEGMDVPQCNLVVRFDPPSDFRAYVQSKGRARAHNSIYVLMTCDNEDKLRLIEDLSNYGSIEKILLNFCHGRELPTEDEIDSHLADQLKEPYMPLKVDGGARVTMSSAISLLNRYCSKLSGDVFTHCVPRWKIKKVEMEGEKLFGYRCKIWMPLISPIRDPIVGDIMKNKHHAKMAAALDACRILHEHNELNDNLLPINFKDEVIGDCADKETYQKELRLGASNTQNCYPKKVLSFKAVTPKSKCYMYVLHMKLRESLERDENETIVMFDPITSSYRFALIATELVKNVPPFYIFTESGKVEVKLEKGKRIALTEKQLDLIHIFHEYTITTMLNLANFPLRYAGKENRQWLLVPVKQEGDLVSDQTWACDWKLMEKVEKEASLQNQPQGSNTKGFNSSDFDDSLLYPIFEPGEYYYIIKIDNQMTSTTPFPKPEFKDYVDFFRSSKKQKIGHPNDPLLEVKHVSHCIRNMPGYFNRKGNFEKQSISRLARRVHFPPELVYILPYPGSLYRQATYLPCILTRIQTLIFSEDLRCTIVRETGIGSESRAAESLDFKGFSVRQTGVEIDSESRETSGSLDKIFDQPSLKNHPGPSTSLVLQAMTSKHYGDFFDLERLETVGDSFLKYAASKYLFCKHPSDNEGKLTVRKTELISNANLLKLGKKKGLPSLMFYTKMDPKVNWLPPGYKLPDGFEEIQSEFSISIPQDALNMQLANIWEMKRDDIHSYFETVKQNIERSIAEQKGIPQAPVTRKLCVLNLRTQNCIGNKSIADCVEALIGVYVVTTGVMGGLRFLNWLGVKVIPEDPVPLDLQSCFVVPPQPVVHQADVDLLKTQYLSGLENLENRINYQFKNKMYLLEALWHPSCDRKPITGCYQRLEFLGDAVLDYIITRYLYEDPRRYNPGELTDIRMALVNNEFFAKLAVRYGFQKHMKYFSPALIGGIMKFVKKLEANDMDFIEEISLKEECTAAAEELEVPKVLGDVVESVAGAIYLDSGLSLKTVWNVFYEMMHKDIEFVRNNIPKNPVRIVYEEFPEKAKFHHSEETVAKKMRMFLDVEHNGQTHRFIGVAENKKTAKLTAARIALKKLCKKEELKNKMW